MALAEIKNPDDIECVLQFTMKLSEWKQIRDTLRKNAAYTELKIIDDISDLVSNLEKTIYPKML